MPRPYNLTGIQGNTDLVAVTQSANILSNYMLGRFFLLVLGVILFVRFKNFDTKVALVSSAFICAIVSMLFRLLDLVGDIDMFGYIMLTAGAFIWLKWGQ